MGQVDSQPASSVGGSTNGHTLPEGAICAGCGYSIRGLPTHRCPECGREFDPAYRQSYLVAGEVPGFLRSFAGPPPRWFNNGVIALSALTLLSQTAPGGVFLGMAISMLAWIFIILAWVFAVLVRAAIRLKYWSILKHEPHHGRAVFLAPAALCVVILASVLALPLRVSFFVSLPFMQRMVARSQQRDAPLPQSGFVGLFPAERIERIGSGFRFIVIGGGFLDSTGFAYDPDGPPLPIGEDTYDRFWGDWYLWTESW